MSNSNFPLSESSTKEEVAEYFYTILEKKEEIKNLILSEYLTGDILPLTTKEELKAIGFKIGPAIRITKEVSKNLDKFKEIKIDIELYPNSSSEEVKNFFEKKIDFKGELNSLDGSKLLELNEETMKTMGLKYGQRKRLIKYIEYFKTLKPPEEEISISRKSSSEEVSKFLKLSLKFSQNIIDDLGLDGESLFDLEDHEIDDITDITPEQKENLKAFIKKQSSKIEEGKDQKEQKTDKEEEIKINRQSNLEDICKFLKIKLNFSDEAISYVREQELGGDALFDLTDEDINNFENTSSQEKEKLIKFIKESNNQSSEGELKIDNKSSKEDVAKFLKNKLNFSETTLKDWKLDGQALLSLIETEIEKLNEISKEEKEKLKKFLSEQKAQSKPEKTVVTTTTEISKEKPEEPKANQDNIVPENIKKKTEDNKEKNKKEDEIKIQEIKEKEKDDNKEINLSKESKKEDIIKFLEKRNLKLENLTEKNIDEMNDIKIEEKDIIKTFINKTEQKEHKNIDNNIDDNIDNIPQEPNIKRATKINDSSYSDLNPKTDNINERKKVGDGKAKKNDDFINKLIGPINEKKDQNVGTSEKKKFYSFKSFEKSDLLNLPYNIFFSLTLTDIQYKTANLATYVDESNLFSNIYTNYKVNLISKEQYENDRGVSNYFFLFQLSNDKPIRKLSVTIKKNKTEYNGVLDTNNIENFFYLNNIKYDTYDDFPFTDMNSILEEYLDYFYKRDDIFCEKLKKSLTKAIMNRISKENNAKISGNNFFRVLKLCAKYEIEIKSTDNWDIKLKKKIDSEYYPTDEDIDKIISKKKDEIIQLIVLIFFNSNPKYLNKFFSGTNGPNFCRSILDLKNKQQINLNNIKSIFEKNEDYLTFQNVLLSVANTKKEIEFVITLQKGLIASLNFIKDNINILLLMDSRLYPIKLEFPNEKYDINDIFVLVNDIVNKSSEKKYKIINVEEIFETLMNYTVFKDLNELCKFHNFVPLITKDKKGINLINTFYKNVHSKGLNLIRNNIMSSAQIFNFIMSQDIYYYSPTYTKSKYREPEIFKYIPITKRNNDDKEYLENINIIRNNRLFDLFSASDNNTQRLFQKILLEQMKRMTDLKSIFEIFPQKKNRSRIYIIN